MVYDGNNYAIHHSPLFYVCFIAAMITATVLMLGLFLIMVGRGSATTKAAGPAPDSATDTADTAGTAVTAGSADPATAVAPAVTAAAPNRAA